MLVNSLASSPPSVTLSHLLRTSLQHLRMTDSVMIHSLKLLSETKVVPLLLLFLYAVAVMLRAPFSILQGFFCLSTAELLCTPCIELVTVCRSPDAMQCRYVPASYSEWESDNYKYIFGEP